jgi:hypothetical membrane protein
MPNRIVSEDWNLSIMLKFRLFDPVNRRYVKMATRVMPRTRTSEHGSTDTTKALLTAGVVSGPLFYFVAIVQMLTRPGFDIRRHALSMLSLGDLGWIQMANFVVTGVLIILCAAGLRHILRGGKGGTWGPLLIGIFGLGAIAAGLFPPDPGLGFPPGAPEAMPTTMSGHASVHALAFSVSFLSLIVACFVFVRAFLSRGQPGWAIYSAASAILAPAFIVWGMSNLNMLGVMIAIAGAFAFGWVSAIAAHFVSELRA